MRSNRFSARWSVLLLTSLSVAAAAAPGVPSPVDLASKGAGFDCSPSPIGSGTLPTTRSNDAGTVAWWYCATPSGTWRVNWAVATAAQMSVTNMLAQARAVLTAADPKAAFSAAVSRNVNLPVGDPSLAAVWKPFVQEMAAGAPATLPPGAAQNRK